ncbi:uncharacterized protein LOC135377722 [Ornithodoros turicata]
MALNFSACEDYTTFKGRLGRGCSWTREETMLLLDLYEKERLAEDSSGDFPPRNTPKYQKVHQAISGFLGAHGYSRTPMQVRERLKRLKRDFRENRHGEFTERVGAILAKRAAAASAERYASAVMAASTNGTTTALSTTVTPTQPSSPEQPMEACYPVVLMKTDMNCHDNLERDGEGERNHHPTSAVVPEITYDSPDEQDHGSQTETDHDRHTEPATDTTGNGNSNIRMQQKVIRLLSQLVTENRRQAQATEAFQRQILYQLHLITCSLQVIATSRTPSNHHDDDRHDRHPTSGASFGTPESQTSTRDSPMNSVIHVKQEVSAEDSS